MAELAKKLHFLKNGTEQTANAYSTVEEVGGNYVQGKIDGVACYIPLGTTDDSLATNGRVKKNGTEYAIKSQAIVPYAEMAWTTAGTYTFTVPSGVTRVRVAVCGGGCGATFMNSTPYAENGGDSYFGDLIVATGGTTLTNAGTPNGRAGVTQSSKAEALGGKGFSLSFTMSNGEYGNGGSLKAYTIAGSYYSGGSGGYDSSYVTVAPNTTYIVKVGKGGGSSPTPGELVWERASMADSAGKVPDGYISPGTGGFVYIAYGGDIK